MHKQACEGMARIFWQEEQVPSIGIRPWIVYGPGRDNGLTASATTPVPSRVFITPIVADAFGLSGIVRPA